MDRLIGKGRFELIRQIGAGGMGVVYEAIDRVMGSRVALKTLRNLDATGIYLFKQEFRSLAELVHPNLIPLYELFAEGDQWFFTMELIEGSDFSTYVRSAASTTSSSVLEVERLPRTILSEPDGTDTEVDQPLDPSVSTVSRLPSIWKASDDIVRGLLEKGIAGSETVESMTPGTIQIAGELPPDPVGWSFDPMATVRTDAPTGATETASIGDGAKQTRVIDRKAAIAADFVRLRAGLRQLAEGVHALHRSGKLHRDIKPSNLLVRHDGRVVLLDFGLVLELGSTEIPAISSDTTPSSSFGPFSGDDGATGAGRIVGTVAYMAPEQAARLPLSEASDWYAVGVVLYQSLTGRLPFEGSARQILRLKQEHPPIHPATLVPGIPDDLSALCVALLERDPKARPTGEQILTLLRPDSGKIEVVGNDSGAVEFMPFVGRDNYLEALEAAYSEMLGGKSVTVEIRGRSGVGKSSLIRRFLGRLPHDLGVVVLAGRCYEQESVPYKGLDSLIDALSRLLLRMPYDEVQALLPPSIAGLVRLFPVLLRVEAVALASEAAKSIPEPQELRRHAFTALRETLTMLSASRPLVLVLDDLQWGDEDSAALLTELLRPPDPPQFLLLALYRSEHDDSSGCLRALRAAGELRHPSQLWHELSIDPLSHQEARRLALRLLGQQRSDAETLADRIAIESRGLPYFVGELARQAQSVEGLKDDQAGTREVDLEDVLWHRYQRLSLECQHMLELVSLAARPIRLRDLYESSSLGRDALPAVSTLRSARLLRRSGPSLDDEVEAFHDRIRETIVARLTPEVTKAHHQRLALTLQDASHVDPETLAVHYLGAERFQDAGEAYARAADRAARALAFERAAKLYRLARELNPIEGETGRRLRLSLAEALVNAGRGAEAAREFLALSHEADSREAHELERRAAYQYCISGRIEEGQVILHRVMGRVGLRMSDSPKRALLSLLVGRLLLSLRGLNHRQRTIDEASHHEIARIDATWSAATGLTVVDTIRAADLQTRNLRQALRLGEPYRVARALAWEAAHAGVPGRKATTHVEKLLTAARAMELHQGNPYIDGLILLASGTSHYFRGDFKTCLDYIKQAIKVFRERCHGVAWELGTAQTFLIWTLHYLGDLAELTRLVPVLLREARDRDDRYLETNLCISGAILSYLTRDDAEAGEAAMRQAMGQWTRKSFHSQHLLEATAAVQLHLYRGDGTSAWQAVTQIERSMRRSKLMRVQSVRVLYLSHRAHAMLAVAEESKNPRSFIDLAARDARRLLAEDAPWSNALGNLIRTSVLYHRGHDVTTRLEKLVTEFDELGMQVFAASARHRLGTILGGELGRDHEVQACSLLERHKVRLPEQMIDVHAPRMKRPLIASSSSITGRRKHRERSLT
jgi:serine/threonine protein kinase/tetratricopeptide (TPR) repeat protein